jgi:hypothetical protein
MEDELNIYIEERTQHIEDDGEEAEDHFVQPSNIAESPYQQPYYDYGPSSSSSSSQEPDYDHANDDPPAWSYYLRWD